MIVKALNETEARRWLETRIRGVEPDGGVYEVGSLPRENVDERLRDLAEELGSIAEELGVIDRFDVAPQRFDGRAFALIHSRLKDLPLRLASNRDFWRYVSCGPLFKLVRWRYPESSAAQNYGVGERFKCLPERLWFRGHIGLAPQEPDPYELARRGTGDFWNECIKHTFGAHRPLVRALVRFQFPEKGDFDERGRYSPQTLSKDGVRTLMRHLQHFSATTEFALLGDQQCTDMIDELAADLPRAGA